VWRFPYDPALPGLAAACDEAAVARLLAELGLGEGPVQLRTRAYRPRRRAVIEASGTRGRLFIKVVRPDRVEALHDRHRLLVRAGIPAPQSLGWTPEGILVLQALPGRTLRQALRSRTTPLPSGSDIVALLDRLPLELAHGRPRQSWLDLAPHYAAVIGAALPAEAGRAARLAEALTAEARAGWTVPTHGDFYENQVLVDDRGRICGLLDVDTAGPGDQLDDLACLLGHLSVLAQVDRERAPIISRAGARYLAAFDQAVPPDQLRYRVAAVVVSLATGSHRVQEQGWQAATRWRLELAEHWLASARAER
jgi:Phosphotransferase enzyme family